MRTTVTLDPDTEALIKQLMRERGLSFKEAVNEAIRRGIGWGAASPQAFRTKTFSMGWREGVSLDRALSIAGELEDEELARRVAARK
jgi:Arc/MetJ family transcription regulator